VHPNFAEKKQAGYRTLYSAHIEKTNKVKKTKRLTDGLNSIERPYEIVLTQWELKTVKNKFTLAKQGLKELFRIPTETMHSGISQLAFNPYTKSWQDDFGLLYIALPSIENQTKSALFSGSVLRINPQNFGVKHYVIPYNNPFIDNDEIPEEVINIGLGQIGHINWVKNNTNELIISEIAEKKLRFHNVAIGKDLREKSRNFESFHQIPHNTVSNILVYSGATFTQYKNHLVYLVWHKNQWKLYSLSTKAPFQTQVLSEISTDLLSKSAKPILAIDHLNEISIFDKVRKTFLSIAPQDTDIQTNAIVKPTIEDETTLDRESTIQSSAAFFVILLIGGILILLKFLHGQHLDKAKQILRNNFAKFSIDEKHKKIHLFRRHENQSNFDIDFSQIKKSEIFLNEQQISIISEENNQSFSNEIEKKMNYHFEKEKREKMIDDKTRQITLVLTDKNEKKHTVCVYFRKGNQRLTKAKFLDVINQLLNWCWLISKTMNSNTEERSIQITPKVVKSAKPTKQNPKTATTNINLAKDHLASAADDASEILHTEITTQDTATAPSKETPQQSLVTHEVPQSSERDPYESDVELINSLEKLATLKHQGILSDTEFNKAKTKILKRLTENR